MTISIALCTYNGSAYLCDQLHSLAAQSRQPDELVICDDCSQDETVSLLHEFAANAPFSVRIIVNEINLGTAENFAQAINLCQGEVIALCDQDDLWHQNKLARLEHLFQSNPKVALAFSDADLIDGQGNFLNSRLWSQFSFSEPKQRQMETGQAFNSLLVQNIVTGAAMAFRSEFKSLVLPIPYGQPLVHDAWIALLIAAVAELGLIEEPLISYRQHERQQTPLNVAGERIRPQDHFRDQVRQLEALAERLALEGLKFNAQKVPAALRLLRAKIAHIKTRTNLPDYRLRRLMPALRELVTGHYHRYSNGWRSVARDLFF